MSQALDILKTELKTKITQLEASLEPLEKITPILSKDCSKCEFSSEAKEQNGFHECWGALAEVKPHIFDLYYAGALGANKLVNDLIIQGKVSLYDVPQEAIKGKRGERQRVQIDCTKTNSEWFSPQLKEVISSFAYPLHFIDFETSRIAVVTDTAIQRPTREVGRFA